MLPNSTLSKLEKHGWTEIKSFVSKFHRVFEHKRFDGYMFYSKNNGTLRHGASLDQSVPCHLNDNGVISGIA